jgi:hypothetical protein
MSANQNPKIIRIVKVILDIIFWMLVIVTVFSLLWTVLSPVILSVTDIVIMSSVPVAIGQGTEPRMEVVIAGSDTQIPRMAFVDEAQGTLRLETTDWYLIFISNLAKLLTAGGLAYLVYLLRSIIIAIQQGAIFTQENVTRIRRLGYLVLIVALVRALLEYVAAYEFFRQLTILSPPLSLPSPFDAGVILASLLILALAQVWSYGLALERERALTI